jgi:hypothetical protein
MKRENLDYETDRQVAEWEKRSTTSKARPALCRGRAPAAVINGRLRLEGRASPYWAKVIVMRHLRNCNPFLAGSTGKEWVAAA